MTASELFLFAYYEKITQLNPKKPGGWGNPPIGQEIACHFLQDHTMAWISRASGWQTERADCNYLTGPPKKQLDMILK